MPQAPATIVVWDNFDGGDYGSKGGERAPSNTFKAVNMIRYADGTIGPRAGLKNITPNSMPNGVLLGLAAGPVVGKDGLFIINTQPYYFDLNTPSVSPTALGGPFAHPPNQPVKPKLQTATWLVPITYGGAPGTSDAVYVLDPSAGTNTPISGSSGGHEVVQEGQQIIVAVSEFSNQIDGSSPVDPTNWTEGRFADIGDDWQVCALFVYRNALLIIKRTGWHELTGVLGDPVSQTIRDISGADGVLHPWQADIDANDTVWFWPLFRRSPGYYAGTIPNYMGTLEFPTRENDDTLAQEPIKRSVVVVDGDQTPSSVAFIQGGTSQMMLVQHNGVWTFHEFGCNVSAMACKNGEQLVITDGGSNVTPAQIYSAIFHVDRPGFVSDDLTSPGDNSTTPLVASFSPAEHWSPDGREFTVRQVIVDFKTWNTGTTANNHFDITIRVLGQADQDGNGIETTEPTQSFDSPTSDSSTSGTWRRKVFEFSPPPGAGVELQITNNVGCAFRSFTLLDPSQSQRPVG